MVTLNRREFLVGATAASAVWPAMAQQAADDPSAATASLRAAVGLAARDPERPVYHFRPPANWTNDPNGTIYYKGWHHLFYQLNPTAPRGGNQHWGHARSRDLVNWEHLPIALWPLTDARRARDLLGRSDARARRTSAHLLHEHRPPVSRSSGSRRRRTTTSCDGSGPRGTRS